MKNFYIGHCALGFGLDLELGFGLDLSFFFCVCKMGLE
jgi:hypothetical protein